MNHIITTILHAGFLVFLCFLTTSCTLEAKLTDTASSALNPDFTPELKMGLAKGLCTGERINSMLPLDRDRLLLSGTFSSLGECTGSSLIYDQNQGGLVVPPDEVKSRIIGRVSKVIPDGQGGWYVGGNIDSVGGDAQAIVSRINADGSLNTTFKAFANTGRSFGYSSVKDMVLIGGKLAVAGSFQAQENPQGGLLTLDTGTSAYPPEFRGEHFASGESATTVISDGNQGWYIGGGFSRYRGEPVQSLIRIDSQGNLIKTFDAKVLGRVHRLYLHSGTNTLYIFGNFIAVNGISRFNAAALDATTGALTNWQPILIGGDSIKGFGVSTTYGKIYLAGEISIEAGPYGHQVAALDLATGTLLESIPISHSSGGNYLFIESLIVNNNVVYIGGQFTTVKGTSRSNAAAIDIATETLTSWQPSNSGLVEVMVKSPNSAEIFLAGGFGIKAVSLTTGATTFTPSSAINGGVATLEVSDDTLYFSGPFNMVGGQYRYRMGAISRSTGLVTPWDPARFEYSGGGYSYRRGQPMAASSSAVYVLPMDPTLGASRIQGLALLDAITGDYLPVDFKVDSEGVTALAVSADANTLYIGGSFKNIMGQTRNGLAALNISSHTLSTWAPSPATGFYQAVKSILVVNNKMYVGGYFLAMGVNNSSKRHLAALDIPSGNATAWNPQPDAQVEHLKLGDGEVFVGGNFNNIASAPRSNVASFDLNTDALKAFEPAGFSGYSIQDVLYDDGKLHIFSDGQIHIYETNTGSPATSPLQELTIASSAALSDGKILIGGNGSAFSNKFEASTFALFNLQNRAFEAIPWSLPSGNAQKLGYLSDDIIYFAGWFQDSVAGKNYGLIIINLKTSEIIKIETDDSVLGAIQFSNTVYFFGSFSLVEGQSRDLAAAISLTDKTLTSWNPSPDGEVTNISQHGGKIYLSGYFTNIGGQPIASLARTDATSGNADSWDLGVADGVDQIIFENNTLYLVMEQGQILGQQTLGAAKVDMLSGNLLPPLSGVRDDWTPYIHLTKNYIIIETGSLAYTVISRTTQGPISIPLINQLQTDSWISEVHEKDGFVYLLGAFYTEDAGISEVRVIRQSDGQIRY